MPDTTVAATLLGGYLGLICLTPAVALCLCVIAIIAIRRLGWWDRHA